MWLTRGEAAGGERERDVRRQVYKRIWRAWCVMYRRWLRSLWATCKCGGNEGWSDFGWRVISILLFNRMLFDNLQTNGWWILLFHFNINGIDYNRSNQWVSTAIPIQIFPADISTHLMFCCFFCVFMCSVYTLEYRTSSIPFSPFSLKTAVFPWFLRDYDLLVWRIRARWNIDTLVLTGAAWNMCLL